MREPLCEKFGVYLSAVEDVSIQTCLAFLGEVGTDAEKECQATRSLCAHARCCKRDSRIMNAAWAGPFWRTTCGWWVGWWKRCASAGKW